MQFKAIVTNLEDLISEITKVTKNIYKLVTYTQIIYYSAHCY